MKFSEDAGSPNSRSARPDPEIAEGLDSRACPGRTGSGLPCRASSRWGLLGFTGKGNLHYLNLFPVGPYLEHLQQLLVRALQMQYIFPLGFLAGQGVDFFPGVGQNFPGGVGGAEA